MINIGIITKRNGFRRGACDFYPIIKWRNKFLKNGYSFKFFWTHLDKNILNNDVVFIDHRYYRELVYVEKKHESKFFILDTIEKLRNKGRKVILFDNGDGAGGTEWELIPHVDVFVKKQIYKDRNKYLVNEGRFSFMPFLKRFELSPQKYQEYVSTDYVPCPQEHLHKIKIGWNIGMVDYRYFPLSRYYPIGTSRLLNGIYPRPLYLDNFIKKNIDSSFRGGINVSDADLSSQRTRVIELLNANSNNLRVVTGKKISRNQYIKELKKSKTCISPYGWGELCFRDFEAIIFGALLIKPDMSHLETYPNIYYDNESYLSVNWELSDLIEKLKSAIENWDESVRIIKNAQNIHRDAVTNYQAFYNQCKNIIE